MKECLIEVNHNNATAAQHFHLSSRHHRWPNFTSSQGRCKTFNAIRHDHEHMIPLQYMLKDPKGTYTAARATASSTVSGAATAGARAGRHGGY